MNIGTLLYIWLFGTLVGTDEFGNNYYLTKHKNTEGKFKRFVKYNGKIEASRVPPLWHAWLHYIIDDLPQNNENYKWQKDHLPNQTGTSNAYLPEGHVLKGGKRKKATGDYQPWQPE